MLAKRTSLTAYNKVRLKDRKSIMFTGTANTMEEVRIS